MTTSLVHNSPGLITIHPFQKSENTLHNRIQEFLAYQEALNRSFRTIRNCRLPLNLLELFMGDRKFIARDFSYLDAWMTQRGLFPITIKIYLHTIKQFLRWCSRRKYMSRDQCEDLCEAIRIPLVPTPGHPEIFTHDEYLRLRDAAAGTPMQWAFILAYHTGLSLIDCCHLRWAQVDLDDLWIKCARIKIRRYGASAICEIPIIVDSDLHQTITSFHEEYDPALRTEDESDYVCPALMKMYSWLDSHISTNMTFFIRKHIGSGKSFHTFRRTFISLVTNSGMSTALACKITAHSDPKMLMRYLHPDKDALRAGVEKALETAKQQSKSKIKGNI